jgi:hypothetical protein
MWPPIVPVPHVAPKGIQSRNSTLAVPTQQLAPPALALPRSDGFDPRASGSPPSWTPQVLDLIAVIRP